MKRILVTILGFIFGASLPIYALFFWEPTDNLYMAKEDKDYSDGIIVKEEDNSVAVMSDISFFKVNQEDIKSSMSKDEIEDLKAIIKKLSVIDIMKINESLEKDDVLTHTQFVINIVKSRLSDSDYNNFEEILSKYIDFSLLNKEI